MRRILKLLTTLMCLVCTLNCEAFVPVMYSKGISVGFEHGGYSLSEREKDRLMKLIAHRDDFSSLNIFLVVARGDEISDDANQDFQAMLAGARANSINSFYAQHAAPQFHELIQTSTEPIKKESRAGAAGHADVVIEGFCKPGHDAVCKEHWPPSQEIEGE